MRPLFLAALLTFSIGLSATAETLPARVGDFALLDHSGTFHQLSYLSDQPAVVLVAHANDSAVLRAQQAALAALAEKYAPRGVQFVFLNANTQDSRADLVAAAKQQAQTWPVLHDEAQLVSQTLGLTRVGELLILDPARLSLLYRGDIAQLADADAAIAGVLAGTNLPAATPVGNASGTAIDYAKMDSAPAVPSYSGDIAPILEKHCVSCHHDGGIGPWSMSSHAMVQGWSPMMREVLMTKRMPPGQVDPHVGKPLLQAAGLSPQELQQLIRWIDAGAPGDAQPDPLTALTFNDSKFRFGEPDLLYTIPAQEIPATGVIDYRYVPVELNLDRDVWVRAMEFVPGDPEVLHHVIAYVSSPADKTVRGRATGAAQGESVGGFAPGRPGDAFRDDSGRLIRKGSNLLLQIHYTTSGKATVDETEIGIYIYDEPPTYVMSGGVAGQRRFLVPPYAKEHRLEGVQEIERDAYLYDLMPHMHYRGKYMNYSAEYPDGTSELLLSVPKYNFNWQFNYALRDPLFLPAGTRLVARGAMDNSAQNTANPDPSKPVHFGLQTKHEMFFGFTTLRYVGDTPEAVQSAKPAAEVVGR